MTIDDWRLMIEGLRDSMLDNDLRFTAYRLPLTANRLLLTTYFLSKPVVSDKLGTKDQEGQ